MSDLLPPTDHWSHAVALPTAAEVGARLDGLMAEATEATSRRRGLLSAFQAAAQRNDVTVAHAVLERVFTDTLFPRTSPLLWAAEGGHLAMVQALLERGQRSNQALLGAIHYGHWTTAQALLPWTGAEASSGRLWAYLPVGPAPLDLVKALAQRSVKLSRDTWTNFLDTAVQFPHALSLLEWALQQPDTAKWPLDEVVERAATSGNVAALGLLLPRMQPKRVAQMTLTQDSWRHVEQALMNAPDDERAKWVGVFDAGQCPLIEGWAQAKARRDQTPSPAMGRPRPPCRS